MRILHITYDFGESSAVFRLASLQRDEGHEVFIYCKRGLFCLRQSAFIHENRLRLAMYIGLNRLDRLIAKACSRDLVGFYSPSLTPANLPNYIKSQQWTVVHIHWIASNFCSLDAAMNLQGRKFLHLHDLWILTGVVPHSVCSARLNDTGKYLQRTISARNKQLIKTMRPVLLAPSRWAQQQAVSLLGNLLTIKLVPGSIPLKFSPGEADAAGLCWPKGRLRLLHVMSGQDPTLKGLDIVFDALSCVPLHFSHTASLIVVGAQVDAITCVNGTIVKFIRSVSEGEMINLYRSADHTVIWSQAETFSQSAAESLACGTPIITHRGLPCATFCCEQEGSIVANNNSSGACAAALLQARRKSRNTPTRNSLYHMEVSNPSATTCYGDLPPTNACPTA